MERITKIDPSEWDNRLVERIRPEDRTPLEQGLMRYFAHRPELALGLSAFTASLKRDRQLDPRLVELVRLRIAFHNQCRSCMAIRYGDAVNAGLTEELVCSLAKPYEAPGLTDAERVAIRFGELFATNHLAIDDAMFEQLHEHFDDGQIIELAFNCALFVGIGRIGALLHMVEELPEPFRGTDVAPGAITPWDNDSILIPR
jgi:AhpD family alkylhydroperoxidase